jgi:hypothetical protein
MKAWPLFSAEIRAIKLTSAALVRLPFGSTTHYPPRCSGLPQAWRVRTRASAGRGAGPPSYSPSWIVSPPSACGPFAGRDQWCQVLRLLPAQLPRAIEPRKRALPSGPWPSPSYSRLLGNCVRGRLRWLRPICAAGDERRLRSRSTTLLDSQTRGLGALQRGLSDHYV